MVGYIGATSVGFDVTEADIKGDLKSTDDSPEVVLTNTTEEDTDGGRESKITFKGEQSGGELSTLAQIQASHDGTADDEKGDLIFSTNDGSDGNTPTERMRIDSDGNVGIGASSPNAKLDIESDSPTIRLTDTDTTLSNNELSSQIEFYQSDASGAGVGASISAYGDGSTGALDLRFATNDNTERMRIDSGGKVGIGLTDPIYPLEVDGGAGFEIYNTTGGGDCINFRPSLGDSNKFNLSLSSYDHSGGGTGPSDGLTLAAYDGISFATGSNTVRQERCRVTQQGDFLVGKTVADNTTTGVRLGASFISVVSGTNGNTAIFNRTGTDGEIVRFQNDNTTVGSIGNRISAEAYISLGSAGLTGSSTGGGSLLPTTGGSDYDDNVVDLGFSSGRFDNIYATNSTINTSDEREKQQIASLTDAEMTAAKAISKLFKTYKWNSAVELKGDAARTHTGVIAQQVETAMTDAGLDAGDYAFFISTTWWETQTDIPAVEADEENGVEAQEAYTRTNIYDTAAEAPEGATECNRKGIRYPELLSFVAAATEQRLASIESRLDALESA